MSVSNFFADLPIVKQNSFFESLKVYLAQNVSDNSPKQLKKGNQGGGEINKIPVLSMSWAGIEQ